MNNSKSRKNRKKILIVTHNLNLEGAPFFLLNLASGLKDLGYSITIISPCDGPIRSFFEKIKIEVRIIDFLSSRADISQAENIYDLIIVNTIIGYKFIKKLDLQKEKIIWCLHESEKDFYFKHFNDLDKEIFYQVKRVVFSSNATREIYEELNCNNNFSTINTLGNWNKIDKYIENNSKKKVKRKLGFREEDFIINIIGTICLRKGQMEFTEAAIEILKKINNPHLKFLMVGGGRGYEYEKEIRKKIEASGLNNQILIVNETKEILDYYFISDIFVCNSYIEAFPMVILEAMAFGLPIVSTDAYGIAEQIEDGKSGLLVMPGDTKDLEKKIASLIKNRQLARNLGRGAKKRLQEYFPFKKMIHEYDSLIQEVCKND